MTRKVLLASLLLVIAWPVLAKPVINLATSDWEPYVGQNLNGNGYITALVKAALEDQGYDVKIHFMPWVQAKNLEANGYDAYFPDYRRSTDNNEVCSHSLFGGLVGFYKRKNSPIKYTVSNPGKNQEQAIQGLRQYTFGVVKDYHNIKALDDAKNIKVVAADNDFQNLMNLQQRKVDLAFTDVFVAEYLIDKNYPLLNDIVFMGPSLESEKLFICFSEYSPDYQEKLNAFNKGMENLKKSGKMNAIIRKYEV